MDADNGGLSDAELGELAAFADGSLPPAERERVAARVERSPELQALVAEQRAALVAVAMLDTPAPERLRAAVSGAAAEASPAASGAKPARRRLRLPRLALAGGLATAVASALVAVVVVGGASAPTVADTARLAARGADAPAPAVDPASSGQLVASVDGVAFPNFSAAFEWSPSGERSDELDGRETRTVFYDRDGEEVAYSIVAGEQLAWPPGARVSERNGIELRSLEDGGDAVVTWLRDGHTCVLSSADVGTAELRELATWTGET